MLFLLSSSAKQCHQSLFASLQANTHTAKLTSKQYSLLFTNLLILNERRYCCTLAINQVNCFIVSADVAEIILAMLSVPGIHALFSLFYDDFTLSDESSCINDLRLHLTNYIFFVLSSTSC